MNQDQLKRSALGGLSTQQYINQWIGDHVVKEKEEDFTKIKTSNKYEWMHSDNALSQFQQHGLNIFYNKPISKVNNDSYQDERTRRKQEVERLTNQATEMQSRRDEIQNGIKYLLQNGQTITREALLLFIINDKQNKKQKKGEPIEIINAPLKDQTFNQNEENIKAQDELRIISLDEIPNQYDKKINEHPVKDSQTVKSQTSQKTATLTPIKNTSSRRSNRSSSPLPSFKGSKNHQVQLPASLIFKPTVSSQQKNIVKKDIPSKLSKNAKRIKTKKPIKKIV